MSAGAWGDPDPLCQWLKEHAERCPRLPQHERARVTWIGEYHRFVCPTCGETSPQFLVAVTPREYGLDDD